jgi:antitoxin HicB
MSKLKYPFLISVLPFGDGSDASIKFLNLPSYPFLISILPAEEGGGYLIEFPDLPGCMSDGETIEETIENGRDAVACWIETAKRYRDKILEPSSTEPFSLQRKLTSATATQDEIS